jgi:hypothetical protein
MATEQFLNQLFDVHTKDLNEFHPGIGEAVFCPICLNIFPREAITQKFLTDGHVWPTVVRKTSKLARSMHVLLCSKCNHTAGSWGDKQMQVSELVKQGDETGDLYGTREVQIIKNLGEKPIKMMVNVSRHLDDKSFTIQGRIDKDLNWVDGSPEDQARFREVYEKGERVTIIINPYRELKSQFIRAGWIMSAYLMAFYHLGYRYILHQSLDPVRDYLLQSFDPITAKDLIHPDDINFTVQEYKSEYFPDPELFFIYPLEFDQCVYLQVNCFKYEIRLPFRYVRSLFESLVREEMPDFDEKLPELQKAGGYLFFPIKQTKSDGNLSIYDFLLGKPILELSSIDGK